DTSVCKWVASSMCNIILGSSSMRVITSIARIGHCEGQPVALVSRKKLIICFTCGGIIKFMDYLFEDRVARHDRP
ncbi:hypothetical protein HAX54_028000, partial [Datura stramonium]|nr:hypothetical protein [Datura stramonium]